MARSRGTLVRGGFLTLDAHFGIIDSEFHLDQLKLHFEKRAFIALASPQPVPHKEPRY
jgi:hypothetical protein